MEQVLTSSWYENGTLYNWAKHSLSNHVNDRQYQKFCSNNNNNNNNNKTLICQSTPVKLMHFENLEDSECARALTD